MHVSTETPIHFTVTRFLKSQLEYSFNTATQASYVHLSIVNIVRTNWSFLNSLFVKKCNCDMYVKTTLKLDQS